VNYVFPCLEVEASGVLDQSPSGSSEVFGR
jgi:hypothetical protein